MIVYKLVAQRLKWDQDHDDCALTRKEFVHRCREDDSFGLRVIRDSYCSGATVLTHLDSAPLPLPAGGGEHA